MFATRFLLAALILPTAPIAAHDTPPAVPPTAPVAVPSPVPPTPAATPTPAPSPSPTPEPTATPPAPAVVLAAPRPIATPRPTASPLPRPTASPTPAPSPSPEPPRTSATPPAIASPLPTDDERPSADGFGWPWMLGAAVLVVGGIGLWLARRQRSPEDEEIGAPTDADEPEAIVPPVVPARPSAPGVGLSLRFRPTRVGFNLLSATVEGELTIVNDGFAPVDDVRVRTALLGAHVQQDADLAAFLAEPMGRPAVPAFALQPGEARTVRVLAAAPRATLRTMIAADRPMFVPVLAVDVRAAAAQFAQGFAVGMERVDSAKLAPFWLDVPDRAYAEVAARPHGPAVVRQPNG